MAEADRLYEQLGTIEDEGKAPYLWYFLALAFFLLPLLVAVVLWIALPPNLQVYAGWLLRFLLGVFGSFLILLLLTFVRMKAPRAGRVVTWVAGLSWIIWAIVTVVRKTESGSVLLALVLGALCLLGELCYVSGFLLPVCKPGGERWKVFRFLLDYLLTVFPSKATFESLDDFIANYPCYVLTDEPHEEDKLDERIPGNPFSQFNFGPGFIICDCDHAIAISDGIKFKGVQGPGVIFTGFGDRPLRTLDLRPQLRTAIVNGLTQDGIQVKVLFFAPFQIHRGGQEPRLGEPLPYRPRDARKAVLSQKIEHPRVATEKELGQVAWDDLPTLLGTRVMQDVLSRYRFDDLYDPHQRQPEPPRRRIAREFLEGLDRELLPLGIQRVPGAGGISDLKPANEEVLEQRIRTWRAEWVRRTLLKQAKAQTERLRRIEHARAQAQADLILRLGARLADIDTPGAVLTPEKIVPEFLRILEEIALQPGLRRYLPRETAQDFRRLREEQK